MTFEQEFTNQLIRLAECRIDSAAWQSWWALHSEEVKMGWQRGIPVLDCHIGTYESDIYIAMATCQKGAEQYLTRKEIPFQHATLYEEGADRERRLYAEKLEQERRKQQEERQKEYEQKKCRRRAF